MGEALDKLTNRLFDFANKGLKEFLDINPIQLLRTIFTKSATEIQREAAILQTNIKEAQKANLRQLSDEQLEDQKKYQERNINLLYKAAANAISDGNKLLAREKEGNIKVLE